MSYLLIVKRLELYMDLVLYKINILLLLLICDTDVATHPQHVRLWQGNETGEVRVGRTRFLWIINIGMDKYNTECETDG